VETQLNSRSIRTATRQDVRSRVVSSLGPLTVAGGVVWALAQPYRITLLHPHHQGFWWLMVEPPLLVIVAGLFFARVIARPLLDDLRGSDAA
jgi:hypothetical protein